MFIILLLLYSQIAFASLNQKLETQLEEDSNEEGVWKRLIATRIEEGYKELKALADRDNACKLYNDIKKRTEMLMYGIIRRDEQAVSEALDKNAVQVISYFRAAICSPLEFEMKLVQNSPINLFPLLFSYTDEISDRVIILLEGIKVRNLFLVKTALSKNGFLVVKAAESKGYNLAIEDMIGSWGRNHNSFLSILGEHKADFNKILVAQNDNPKILPRAADAPFDVTPLAYYLLVPSKYRKDYPFSHKVIDNLRKYGADVNHESVTKAIYEHIKPRIDELEDRDAPEPPTHSWEREITAVQAADYVLNLRGEKPLPPLFCYYNSAKSRIWGLRVAKKKFFDDQLVPELRVYILNNGWSPIADRISPSFVGSLYYDIAKVRGRGALNFLDIIIDDTGLNQNIMKELMVQTFGKIPSFFCQLIDAIEEDKKNNAELDIKTINKVRGELEKLIEESHSPYPDKRVMLDYKVLLKSDIYEKKVTCDDQIISIRSISGINKAWQIINTSLNICRRYDRSHFVFYIYTVYSDKNRELEYSKTSELDNSPSIIPIIPSYMNDKESAEYIKNNYPELDQDYVFRTNDRRIEYKEEELWAIYFSVAILADIKTPKEVEETINDIFGYISAGELDDTTFGQFMRMFHRYPYSPEDYLLPEDARERVKQAIKLVDKLV